MKMKKLLALLLATMMLLALCACGDEPVDENAPFVFERPIEIVCPWGAGGGADTTLRQFATLLQQELGQTVNVNNVAGAGGVQGVQYVVQQPSDGYTWLMCTPSPMLAQISGATEFDVYGQIKPICNMVWDCNIFVTSSNSPYNSWQELVDYIDANPGAVQCGVMTKTGLDGACVVAAFDNKVEAVGYTEGSQLNSDVIGGHIALACVGPAEVLAMLQSGDMKGILACTEKRLTIDELKDVECAGEVGVDCYYGPYRGIFCKNDMPQNAIDAFVAAAEKVVNSDEFQNWTKTQNLDQRTSWMDPATYQAQWDADYKELTEMFGS
ncbi:MAG: tripartite tricarboxylate transporter substrate binding protein [Butyricicoccus sp.]|nr:tripartite tricarboxylate transporter substrate binding protein [Butyricicoccus sp.]